MTSLELKLFSAITMKDNAVNKLAGVELPMITEDQAYKKACIRAGYEMALAIMADGLGEEKGIL